MDQNHLNREAQRELQEHEQAKKHIVAILASAEGQQFMAYLFKSLDVGVLPDIGLEGSILMDRLGFLRAGNSIFVLACEAAPEITAQLLARLQKERNHELRK